MEHIIKCNNQVIVWKRCNYKTCAKIEAPPQVTTLLFAKSIIRWTFWKKMLFLFWGMRYELWADHKWVNSSSIVSTLWKSPTGEPRLSQHWFLYYWLQASLLACPATTAYTEFPLFLLEHPLSSNCGSFVQLGWSQVRVKSCCYQLCCTVCVSIA